MTDPEAASQLAQATQKWREFVERRRDAYVEMYQSGRWTRYHSEEALVKRMREVIASVERWNRIAPPQDRSGRSDDAQIGKQHAA